MLEQWIPLEQQTFVISMALGVSFAAVGLYLLYRKIFHEGEPESTQKINQDKSQATKTFEVDKVHVGEAVPAGFEAETMPAAEERKPGAPAKATKDLREALSNTRSSFLGRIKSVFSSGQSLGDDELEELEEILYTSDIGPSTVQRLVESISNTMSHDEKSNFEAVRSALHSEILRIFNEVNVEEGKDFDGMLARTENETPQIWMIVGVNGAGKTTTIGKLAHRAALQGKKTLVVAGDTFRAAAGDQLKVWTERAGVEIFSPEGVTDPSAVVFDAIQSAKSKGYDLVIVDTAGRLHTQENLMEELKKMKRVITKHMETAPQETLIVLDSNSGQNALIQTEKFHEALELSGAVLTKLDGSAKGGVAVGLASQFHLPIKMIGVGEGMEDLRPFEAQEFVDSIL